MDGSVELQLRIVYIQNFTPTHCVYPWNAGLSWFGLQLVPVFILIL